MAVNRPHEIDSSLTGDVSVIIQNLETLCFVPFTESIFPRLTMTKVIKRLIFRMTFK